MDLAAQVAHDGFAIVPDVLDPATVALLVSAINRVAPADSVRSRRGVYAMRNLLDLVPEIQQLAHSSLIGKLVEPVLGNDSFPVRGVLFDKTPDANWKVPWHQDLSIAVQRRIEMAGYGPWSVKAGVQHVQPPVDVLKQMLAVRIHLDDSDASNGPVRVIPGSHANGRLKDHQIRALTEGAESVSCLVRAGGAILMKPLLLHASSASSDPRHRRVIHMEYAACRLPGGLQWFSGGQP
jgi:ectoine hydroxylase-related dioxygenase (phytanoyl-CoA dioxygenase family)